MERVKSLGPRKRRDNSYSAEENTTSNGLFFFFCVCVCVCFFFFSLPQLTLNLSLQKTNKERNRKYDRLCWQLWDQAQKKKKEKTTLVNAGAARKKKKKDNPRKQWAQRTKKKKCQESALFSFSPFSSPRTAWEKQEKCRYIRARFKVLPLGSAKPAKSNVYQPCLPPSFGNSKRWKKKKQLGKKKKVETRGSSRSLLIPSVHRISETLWNCENKNEEDLRETAKETEKKKETKTKKNRCEKKKKLRTRS